MGEEPKKKKSRKTKIGEDPLNQRNMTGGKAKSGIHKKKRQDFFDGL